MEHIVIKSFKDFSAYCREKYNQLKNKNISDIPNMSLELYSSFNEFEKLNDYLDRFANFNGESDPTGVIHKSFLRRIRININTEITNIENFNNIKRFWSNWEEDVFKINISFCQIIFRFIFNFENKANYDFITQFEKNYSMKFLGNIKYAFIVDKKKLRKGQWLCYEHDEKNEPFTFSHLTNLLLKCKKESYINNFSKIYINIKNGDEKHIPTYVSSLINDRFLVVCNGKILCPNAIENFGALPPAVFVTTKNLRLLQQPLKLPSGQNIQHQNFDDEIWGEYKDFKPYLKICYRYLFEEFKGNESVNYTHLRRLAYSSEEFTEYVKGIPFLALLIFAMYDSSYRSDLLFYAKESYGTLQLKETDFILERQNEQSYDRFEIYKKKRDTIDVKNLLINADEVKGNTELHSTVISEIFECVSIAEGLLQILENAALHAGGGLFSMRIYSRATQSTTGKDKKEEHVEYLNAEYSPDYFELDGIKGTSYFLEVQISDLSDKSISEKFIVNYTDPKNIDAKNEKSVKIKELIEKYKEDNVFNLKYFFNPKDAQIVVKQKFFNIDNKNFVFHYGLEIFRTLVSARKGIFAACGYNEIPYENFGDLYSEIEKKKQKLIDELKKSFSNISEKSLEKLESKKDEEKKFYVNNITRNKAISGTTYRMLLPLNHNSITNSIAVNNEVEIILDDNCISEITNIDPVNVSEMLNSINSSLNICNYGTDIDKKRKRIENISAELEKKFKGQQLLCLNFNNDKNIGFFEETIKGSVLAVLNILEDPLLQVDAMLPVALVNLTPFQLVEAARILAIFYSNNAIAQKNNFENFQFYLKSIDGKDLIFAGKDISKVRERLLKTAMANGAMNNDLNVVDQLLGRMTKNGQE